MTGNISRRKFLKAGLALHAASLFSSTSLGKAFGDEPPNVLYRSLGETGLKVSKASCHDPNGIVGYLIKTKTFDVFHTDCIFPIEGCFRHRAIKKAHEAVRHCGHEGSGFRAQGLLA